MVFATGIGGISSLLASDAVMREKPQPGLAVHRAPADAQRRRRPDRHEAPAAPNFTTTTACAASNHAIGLAFQAIRHGEATAAIAGGSESAFVQVALIASPR